jgi:hypothetical protein
MSRSIPLYFIKVLPVFALLVISGCKKNDSYRLSGLLLDPNQKIPVAGATVEIWTQQIKSGIFEANYQLASEQVTDIEGKFQSELPSAQYTGIKINFSKIGYFRLEAQEDLKNLRKDYVQYSEYHLLPKAWLDFHVFNNNPFDPDDYFEFKLMDINPACEDCCKEEIYQFSGVAVNMNFECLTAGHHDLVIQSTNRKNNQQVFKTESVFIKAFDTTRIELIY